MEGLAGSRFAPGGVGLLIPVLVGLACSPEPINDALGWNGRGMPLPRETGAGGDPGPGGGEAGAGAGPATGAAGADPSMGAAGADPSIGAAGAAAGTGAAGTGAGTGEAGRPGSGAAGSTAGASGQTGTPDAGTSGVAGTGAGPRDAGVVEPPAMGTVAATCRLDVSVTTKDTGRGTYAPRNVGAIWIETGAGKFIKSLNVWAAKRINHLDRWNASTNAAGLSRNRVDAVTAATMSNHGTRTASWNCTDTNKQLVAAGAYQVCFDLNDTNSASKSNCVPVTLGRMATTSMAPDSLPSFTARRLTFSP